MTEQKREPPDDSFGRSFQSSIGQAGSLHSIPENRFALQHSEYHQSLTSSMLRGPITLSTLRKNNTPEALSSHAGMIQNRCRSRTLGSAAPPSTPAEPSRGPILLQDRGIEITRYSSTPSIAAYSQRSHVAEISRLEKEQNTEEDNVLPADPLAPGHGEITVLLYLDWEARYGDTQYQEYVEEQTEGGRPYMTCDVWLRREGYNAYQSYRDRVSQSAEEIDLQHIWPIDPEFPGNSTASNYQDFNWQLQEALRQSEVRIISWFVPRID